jgi:hypothetical protein
MSLAASRWKGAGAIAVLTMLLVALAYALPAEVEIDFGRGVEGLLGTSGFYDAEGGFRWSRARGEIVFPDPGARDPVRLELVLSGFRPPGVEPPRVVLEASGKSFALTPSRRIETQSFEIETVGLWSSTTTVRLWSETFTPQGADERALGVRVHRARLILDGPGVAPLKQVLASGAAAGALALLLGAPAAAVSGVLLAFAFVFFRFYAALGAPVLAAGALLAIVIGRLFPGLARLAGEIAGSFGRSLLEGPRTLRKSLAVPAAGLLILATIAAYAVRPRFTLDLGTGEAEPLLLGFAGFDRDEEGALFRRPFPGATIDLRDFGASSPWTLTIRAASDPPRQGVLARAADETLSVGLDRSLDSYRFDLPAPRWAFRAGHLLRFPGFGPEAAIRISEVEVDRGRSLPPLKVVALVLGSAALFAAAFGACGLSPGTALGLSTAIATFSVVGLGTAPAFFVPFQSQIALAASASVLAAAAARAVLAAISKRGLAPEPSAAALAIATAAFGLWFLATASPLYKGGHFSYHSSVAEEISQGKFFLYYFPGPENMLSHQPQWGNLTVPHPSLYHTVTSPLALFPRNWFHLLTKLFLALLLFGVALVSATVAHAAGGSRAGLYAAMAAAAFPTSFQLLGLGHLMTIFGTFAAAVALGFLALAEEQLERRGEWLLALSLVTFAFLSYTGSLLFGSIAIAFASVALLRSEPRLAKRLGGLLLAGWGLALALYYVHWVTPFVRDTLPAMLSGGGSDRSIDLMARLKLLPGKAAYTFGSFWVPVLGLSGLVHARGRPRRLLLYGWALALPLFSLLDLAFNFLLKHHYFSFPAVAVGFGLALGWLEEKTALRMAVFLLVVVSLGVMGVSAAFRLATGAF